MFVKYLTLTSGLNFLLLALVLLVRKTPNNANKIIGCFFFIMAVYSYIVSYRFQSIEAGNFTNLMYYTPVDGIFLLMLGPCVYFFIRSILYLPVKIFSWKNTIHLIPFIPFVAFNFYFSTLPFQDRINWLIRDFGQGTIETNWLNVVLYVQIPIYLLISYSIVQKKLSKSPMVFVSNMQIDISWIKSFLTINILYVIISAPLCFYLANEKANIIIGSIGVDIQFIYLFVKVTWRKEIAISENFRTTVKTKDSILKMDEFEADEYLQILQEFMQKEKPFLKEDCNLFNIAENTGITAHQLSYIVNHRLNKHFTDYINGYRIDESKKMLTTFDGEKTTIELVSLNCGFGSKSSFNKAFKKHTNLTPSEFRNKYRINQNNNSFLM